jgi:hypothetical protein
MAMSDDAAVEHDTERAVCRTCERSWSGGGVEAVGEAHAARYDHRVEVIDRTIFAGPAGGDGDE